VTTLRITRLRTDPDNVTEMPARRYEVLAAVSAAVGGLDDTRLARIDNRTWSDLLTWDTREHLGAAACAIREFRKRRFVRAADGRDRRNRRIPRLIRTRTSGPYRS
jgi:hypothetical protein